MCNSADNEVIMPDEKPQSQTTNIDFETVAKSFESVLNRHGHGFQYAVLDAAINLAQRGKSKWRFEAAEVPVQVQGKDTHIDFVLSKGIEWDSAYTMVAECKRANPKLKTWCFAKAPFVHRTHAPACKFYMEQVSKDNLDRFLVRGYQHDGLSPRDAYHVGWEIKGKTKGDDRAKGHGDIKDAITQVLRGASGYIEFLCARQGKLSTPSEQYVVPVVFTTAKLLACSADLRRTELDSGNIEIGRGELEEKPWVNFQYNVTPGLKHSTLPTVREVELHKAMENEFIRTVAIVNESGIEEFLSTFMRDW